MQIKNRWRESNQYEHQIKYEINAPACFVGLDACFRSWNRT